VQRNFKQRPAPRSARRLAAAVALACAGGALIVPPSAAEELDRIVLRVNDRIATLLDYQQRRDTLLREAQRRDLQPDERRRLLEEAPEQIFKELFEELLLQSRADQLAVEVPEDRIQATIDRMKEGYGITSDEQFQQALADSGLTEQQLRQQVTRNLRMRAVMEREVQERVAVDEEDLRRIYGRNPDRFRLPEQRRLREVVVLDASGRPLEERQRIAGEVREELAKGAPESELVAGYAGQGVTSNVIDIGWVSPGDLAKDLETAAFRLPPGQVSEPIAGRGGLHVVHVLEARPSRVQTFAEVQETLRREEEDRVYREEIAEYLKELQQQSYVVAKPPAEAADFRRLLGVGLPEEVMEGQAAPPGTAPPAEAIPSLGETPVAPAPSPTEGVDPGDPGQLPVPKPDEPPPPEDEPPY
jgi:parvulin-like peptidyl-prolyl isomerase